MKRWNWDGGEVGGIQVELGWWGGREVLGRVGMVGRKGGSGQR